MSWADLTITVVPPGQLEEVTMKVLHNTATGEIFHRGGQCSIHYPDGQTVGQRYPLSPRVQREPPVLGFEAVTE